MRHYLLYTISLFALLGCAHHPINWRQVKRVIDGDTVVLDGGEKIRLIGVDTPETIHPEKPIQYFGSEASTFTRTLAEKQNVRLEYDRERIDKYGRTLGYVFIEGTGLCRLEEYVNLCRKNEILLNAALIREGYGTAYLKYPFKRKFRNQFKRHEEKAKMLKKGMWINPACIGEEVTCGREILQ